MPSHYKLNHAFPCLCKLGQACASLEVVCKSMRQAWYCSPSQACYSMLKLETSLSPGRAIVSHYNTECDIASLFKLHEI